MAKVSERTEALQLRRQGKSYHDLVQQFGIAKSTLWRWLKAEGLVEAQPQRLTELRRLAQRKGTAAVRAKYLATTKAIIEQAKTEIGHLSQRDLLLFGVALYWAEGTKQKPHNIAQRVTFTNSNPTMLRVFLAWLSELCHVSTDRLTFELYIHESANVKATQAFWSSALQIPSERFRVRLKRHKVSPHRRNVGEQYVGLVRVTVQRSAALNRKIAGWVEGLCQSTGESANGKPSDFGSEYPGSIPGSPAFSEEPSAQQHEMEFNELTTMRRDT